MKNGWDDRKQPVAAGPAPAQPWQLCLYVAGAGARAQLAEANVRRCCEANFAGCYQLEVVDLRQRPELAGREQLLALPALVRQQPSPRRALIGIFADEAQLLRGLAEGAGC